MEDMIKCPLCEIWFEVIWNYNGIDEPEYCPFCGVEIDYKALIHEEG